jgi:hypothetical protein
MIECKCISEFINKRNGDRIRPGQTVTLSLEDAQRLERALCVIPTTIENNMVVPPERALSQRGRKMSKRSK